MPTTEGKVWSGLRKVCCSPASQTFHAHSSSPCEPWPDPRAYGGPCWLPLRFRRPARRLGQSPHPWALQPALSGWGRLLVASSVAHPGPALPASFVRPQGLLCKEIRTVLKKPQLPIFCSACPRQLGWSPIRWEAGSSLDRLSVNRRVHQDIQTSIIASISRTYSKPVIQIQPAISS